MTDVAWVTLGLVVVTGGLVVATGIYVVFVFRQMKQFRKFALKQIRYQVEGHTTQLRIKKAELEFNQGLKAEARNTLNEREKQCKETVDRIEAELQSL
jgi:uncharacterized protein (DUF3084 family)